MLLGALIAKLGRALLDNVADGKPSAWSGAFAVLGSLPLSATES